MHRFRACCAIHGPSGLGVIPAIWTFRVSGWMKNKMKYSTRPPSVQTFFETKSQAQSVLAWMRMKSSHVPFPAFWPGIETVLLQDVAYRRFGNALDAQLLEFAENPTQSPTALPGHLHDQFSDRVRRPRPARFAGGLVFLFRPFGVTGPAGEGAGRDDRDQMLDRRSQRFAELDQPSPFPRCADDPLGQFGAENPVFLLQVFHVAGELGLRGAGQDQQKRVEKSRHGDITVSRCGNGSDRVFAPRP